jgi:phosphoribosylformylglycinamidine (FGAM) synthase-like enzyme
LTALATLSALQEILPAAERADVDAVGVVRLGDHSVATATVVVSVPPYEEVLAGAAVVRPTGEHDAMARAILDATNRRLHRLT